MKQEMILTTEKLVFVTDPDESDKNIENLVTEFNTNLYRIKIDRTLKPPYYELFHEWKEGRRVLHNRLFASGKLEKVVDFINLNIQKRWESNLSSVPLLPRGRKDQSIFSLFTGMK